MNVCCTHGSTHRQSGLSSFRVSVLRMYIYLQRRFQSFGKMEIIMHLRFQLLFLRFRCFNSSFISLFFSGWKRRRCFVCARRALFHDAFVSRLGIILSAFVLFENNRGISCLAKKYCCCCCTLEIERARQTQNLILFFFLSFDGFSKEKNPSRARDSAFLVVYIALIGLSWTGWLAGLCTMSPRTIAREVKSKRRNEKNLHDEYIIMYYVILGAHKALFSSTIV